MFLTLSTSVFDFLRLRKIRSICIEQVRKYAMPKAKNLLLYYSRGVYVCVCVVHRFRMKASDSL